MNSGKDFSDAMQQNYQDRQQAARDGSQGSGGAGGGIGNLGGWILFAAMGGAVVGFIVGHGAMGAMLGALLFGGLLWAPVAFLKSSGAPGASRTAVILWAVGGAIAGVVLAITAALVWDIVFLEDLPVGTMIFNGGLLGALGMGGYKLSKR